MKRITYAGESIVTSNDVATALVSLTAALANRGLAQAAQIPICDDDGGNERIAELVIGLGNDVLAVPHPGADTIDEPDFSADVQRLHDQLDFLTRRAGAALHDVPAPTADPGPLQFEDFEYEFLNGPPIIGPDPDSPGGPLRSAGPIRSADPADPNEPSGPSDEGDPGDPAPPSGPRRI